MARGITVHSLTVSSNNLNGRFSRGDILTSDGSVLQKLPVGCDGDVLTADSSKTAGMSWTPRTEGICTDTATDMDTDSALDTKLQSLDTYLYEYELNNTPIVLTNADFVNGTYRIRTSGVYKLSENIVFNPNASDDHMPTQQQINSGEYPVMPAGPYHLGFFAAISVEANNVVIDLNGYRIDQHIAHQLQQRFYSCIELGSSPFIVSQGPSNFGNTVVYPEKVLIRNGTLGKSSHHGIHGNSSKDIIISDVNITAFEVAGLAINGSTNILCRNVRIHDNELNIPVVATYSQSRFIRSFLRNIINDNGSPGPLITIKGVSKSGLDILNELEAEMANVYDVVVNGNGDISDYPNALFYENTHVGVDGCIYGMAFNTVGVLVNGFIQSRDALNGGNENIKLQNVTIENLESTPMEVIGLTDSAGVTDYGMNLQKGPVGDVFRILDVTNTDGSYKPNVLANAQIYIASVGVGAAQRGGINIDSNVMTWTSGSATFIDGTHYYACGGDSMAHVMKGNVGLFLSGATNVVCDEVVLSNLKNNGGIGENEKTEGILCENSESIYEGNNNRGIAFVSSKDCVMKNVNVSAVESETGNGMNYDYVGENVGILHV